MLCKYDCGNEGKFKNKDGSVRCSKNPGQCPVNIKKRVKTRQKTGYEHSSKTKEKISKASKGRTHTEETKEKMSASHKGRIVSEDTKEKIAQSNKEYWNTNKRDPWNKGKKGLQTPWNKGLKKIEPLEILERDDPIYADFGKYRNRVSYRTKRNYEMYKEQLNPNNLSLGKAGIDGAHHIDHIVSVREGFEKGIPVENIADPANLQVIPWLDNIRKYDGKGKRKNSI
jgi:hypothetical protein